MNKVALVTLLISMALTQINQDGKMVVLDWVNQVRLHNLRTDVTWKANLASELDYSDPAKLMALIGAKKGPDSLSVPPPSFPARLLQTIPTTLDLRTKYPKCLSLSYIRNQGQCGTCWAFSTMTSLTDRICIASYTKATLVQRSFSYEDLLECCPQNICGFAPGKACGGGYIDGPMAFAKSTGLVTGEEKTNTGLCKPYFLSPSSSKPASSPLCTKKCNPLYTAKTYAADKQKITSYKVYSYPKLSITQMISSMKLALVSRGTLVAFMDVYQDFYSYSSGVYKHVWGANDGGHAIRLIGWGVTSTGKAYWICANSWGASWGQKGYFWIALGSNESSIEEYVVEGNI